MRGGRRGKGAGGGRLIRKDVGGVRGEGVGV